MNTLTQTITPELVEVSLASFGNISIFLIIILTSAIGAYFVSDELNLSSQNQEPKL